MLQVLLLQAHVSHSELLLFTQGPHCSKHHIAASSHFGELPPCLSLTCRQVPKCKTLRRPENRCQGQSRNPDFILGDGSLVKLGK